MADLTYDALEAVSIACRLASIVYPPLGVIGTIAGAAASAEPEAMQIIADSKDIITKAKAAWDEITGHSAAGTLADVHLMNGEDVIYQFTTYANRGRNPHSPLPA